MKERKKESSKNCIYFIKPCLIQFFSQVTPIVKVYICSSQVEHWYKVNSRRIAITGLIFYLNEWIDKKSSIQKEKSHTKT